MTKARQAVLEVIERSVVPLSVGEIHGKLQRPMDLVTVYRALKYLEERGLLESFSFTCAVKRTERYYYRRQKPHTHFFHCEGCHSFLDLGRCQMDQQVAQLESQYGVKIATHTLYYTGLCPRCLEGKEARARALI